MNERDAGYTAMNQKNGGCPAMNGSVGNCSEFVLKIAALVFMVLDHVHSYLGAGSEWFGLLPRFVAPLFVYFLVEGFYHTHSWKKYFLRVFSFAMVMLAGNMIINYMFHSVNYMTGEMDLYSLTQGNNIFLTLVVYLLILKLVQEIRADWGKQAAQEGRMNREPAGIGNGHTGREKQAGLRVKRYGYPILVFCLSVLSFPFCEGSIYLLPLLFVFYFCHGKKSWICVGVVVWSVLLLAKALLGYYSGGTGISLYSTLCFSNEWAMVSVLIPICLYSGRRGNNSKAAKWMFYIVYPAHLWILMIWANMAAGR